MYHNHNIKFVVYITYKYNCDNSRIKLKSLLFVPPYLGSSAGFNLLTGEPEAPAHSNQQRGGAQARQDPANMAPAGGRIGEKQVTRKNPPGGFSSFSFGNE